MVMKDKKYILFDLDGTLIDPRIGITNSLKYAFKVYDMNLPMETLLTFIGPPLVDTFKAYDLNPDEAIEHFRTYFKKSGIKEFTVYNEINDLLKILTNKGYILAVATSKPTVFARQILEEVNLSHYFKEIEGSHLDNTRTDKSEIIEAVLGLLQAPKDDVVMIGDRKHDIIGANKQGVHSIGVTYGYGSKEELLEACATVLVDTPLEISRVLSEV